MQASQYAIKTLPEVLHKRITEDVFETPVGFTAVVVFSPAGGETKACPVCRLVACSGEAPLGIDEGLKPDDLVGVDSLPIGGYPLWPSFPEDERQDEGRGPRER
jgi:hypothetical protein